MPKSSHSRHGKGGGGKFATVMREFKHGKLHSGSKHGPIVHGLKQAEAIAIAEKSRAEHRHRRHVHHHPATHPPMGH